MNVYMGAYYVPSTRRNAWHVLSQVELNVFNALYYFTCIGFIYQRFIQLTYMLCQVL